MVRTSETDLTYIDVTRDRIIYLGCYSTLACLEDGKLQI